PAVAGLACVRGAAGLACVCALAERSAGALLPQALSSTHSASARTGRDDGRRRTGTVLAQPRAMTRAPCGVRVIGGPLERRQRARYARSVSETGGTDGKDTASGRAGAGLRAAGH